MGKEEKKPGKAIGKMYRRNKEAIWYPLDKRCEEQKEMVEKIQELNIS